MKESIVYYSLRAFGFIIRMLPLSVVLFIGRIFGMIVYYFDVRHKRLIYGNLKMAFAGSKSWKEIKRIAKDLFKNYGQNIVEFLRLPLMRPEKFEKLVEIQGKEYVDESLKKGKGLILLAMHFGSWEVASLSCSMLGYPYKVIVKPQERHSRLDELLNSYRTCGGSIVITRGMGTRDFVKSLKNNEIIGMVADQGGREGLLVPFFSRGASMSVGAIRMGLKWGVPVCFAVVIRQKNGRHKLIIHKPLDIVSTGNLENDIKDNLQKVVLMMEDYIQNYPAEYMWFYKIWKYSKQANIYIFSDGKTGHYRQSQLVARMTQEALAERGIEGQVSTVPVTFKNKFLSRLFSCISFCLPPIVSQGRLGFLKLFLTPDSFEELARVKADFIISCGSSVAGINYLSSLENNTKSIVVQRPGILSFRRFDLVILPQHDFRGTGQPKGNVVFTYATPNLVDPAYMEEQTQKLLDRYSHLKSNVRMKIGVFLGGKGKDVYLTDDQIKILSNQLINAANALKADLLITTSRRTPPKIENLLYRQFKKHPRCPLLIIANNENIPEAVGGIIGLSDILVVSGDSISMVSEAATSGKKTIVFSPKTKEVLFGPDIKHNVFIEKLNAQGYILAAELRTLPDSIFDLAKSKIQTRSLKDHEVVLDALRDVI